MDDNGAGHVASVPLPLFHIHTSIIAHKEGDSNGIINYPRKPKRPLLLEIFSGGRGRRCRVVSTT